MFTAFNHASRKMRIAACLALAFAVLPYSAAIAQDYNFSRVQIQGNASVDAASILKFARIEQGVSLSAAQLNDAMQRVTDSGLFGTVEFVPNGGTLVIKVTELPVIGTLDFQGNKRLKDEVLAEAIASQSRRVFSPATAEADAATITDLYRARGRLAATVEPKIIPRGAGRVDLVFEITEGRVAENESIAFVGNRAFSDRRLRQVLQTKQAGFLRQLIQRDTFKPEQLEVDKQLLRDFYLSRGYADIEVIDASADLSRERDATFVAFTISEGQRYSFGKVAVVSEIADLDTADFTAALRLKSGAVYSPYDVETSIGRLDEVALRKNLNFVQVEPRITRNPETQTLDLDLVLKRGEKIFVERIDIEGNTTTIDQVVRRQFKSAEGDAFNPSDVRQAAERIRALGFFTAASVDAAEGSNPQQVVVNVDLEEAPTGSLSFGFTYGTDNGAGILLGYSETNFLGRGQGLNLNVSTSSDVEEYDFGFSEPALLGRNLRFRLSGQYKSTDQADANYNTNIAAISPALEFPIGDRTRLELRYRTARESVINSSSTSGIIIAESARGAERTSSLGYTLNFDTRGGLNSRGGVLLRFGQDFAGLGGDVNYISSKALAVAETKILNEEVTLRAIAEGGVITSLNGYQTRVTDRFFGAGGIRGFERNGIGPREAGDALGGNMFASVRLEAEFPLGLPEEYGITGGAFLDMGSVWGLDSAGTAQGVDSAMRSAGGLSILWNTPIGPLRMNFSRPIKNESYDLTRNFELTISTKF
jgi:outer membrane protein insertion porin family